MAAGLSPAPRHGRLSGTPPGQWQTFVSTHDLDSGELIRAQSIGASPVPCLSPLPPMCPAGTRGVPRTPARGLSRAGASTGVLQAHGDMVQLGGARCCTFPAPARRRCSPRAVTTGDVEAPGGTRQQPRHGAGSCGRKPCLLRAAAGLPAAARVGSGPAQHPAVGFSGHHWFTLLKARLRAPQMALSCC